MPELLEEWEEYTEVLVCPVCNDEYDGYNCTSCGFLEGRTEILSGTGTSLEKSFLNDAISAKVKGLLTLKGEKEGEISFEVPSAFGEGAITVLIKYKIQIPFNRDSGDELYFNDDDISYSYPKDVEEGYLQILKMNDDRIKHAIRKAYYGDE